MVWLLQNSQQKVPARGSNEAAFNLLRQVQSMSLLFAQGSDLAGIRQIANLDDSGGQVTALPEKRPPHWRYAHRSR